MAEAVTRTQAYDDELLRRNQHETIAKENDLNNIKHFYTYIMMLRDIFSRYSLACSKQNFYKRTISSVHTWLLFYVKLFLLKKIIKQHLFR